MDLAQPAHAAIFARLPQGWVVCEARDGLVVALPRQRVVAGVAELFCGGRERCELGVLCGLRCPFGLGTLGGFGGARRVGALRVLHPVARGGQCHDGEHRRRQARNRSATPPCGPNAVDGCHRFGHHIALRFEDGHRAQVGRDRLFGRWRHLDRQHVAARVAPALPGQAQLGQRVAAGGHTFRAQQEDQQVAVGHAVAQGLVERLPRRQLGPVDENLMAAVGFQRELEPFADVPVLGRVRDEYLHGWFPFPSAVTGQARPGSENRCESGWRRVSARASLARQHARR